LAPQFSGTIGLDYSRPVSFGLFSANINAQYQDSTNSGVTLPTGYLDDRTLVGAMLMLSEIDLGSGYGELKVRLWGKNLLDQEYYIGAVRQPSFDLLGLTGGVGTFGDPRTYGVTLEYNFF
jgi:outer membrane receptor protein involved in Fe transport